MERKTKQKDAIWQVFEEADRPLSPQEALAACKESVSGIGSATVYRAINDFVSKKKLVPVEIPGGGARYEVMGKAHHHHFLCRDCDRLFEVESCHGKIDVGTPKGFKTERHEVILHGLCMECLAD